MPHTSHPEAPLTRQQARRGLTWLGWSLLIVAVGGTGLARAAENGTLAVPRVLREVRNDERIAVPGSAHPRARAQDDRGAVDDTLRLEQMVLVLQASAAQEQALAALQQAQQDPNSPDYRQWLSPQAFAERFGVAQADIDTITAWLTQQGLRVDEVSAGRRSIVFSGNARQVREAFGVKLRYYERGDRQRHIAHADPVQLPAALAEVVAGIASLHDFRSEPQHLATPLATYGNAHYLAAGDFHTIYNLKSVLAQGLNGSGRTIAVIGRSNIALSDVTQFRNSMALPSNPPQIINGGTAPGFVTGDELESNLDVEWAGAVATQATVKFVTTASTTTSDGITLSAQYAVNNNIGDVITVSYGLCEALMGVSSVNFFNNLWQQAAAQGQTVVVSSGDSGAAGCDLANATTATRGLGVNGICTSQHSTCVGGTQFNDTASPSTWWSGSNDAGGASALSYIPEVAWNESGTNGGSGLWSSGGGASTRFNKPSWQNTVGVPADGRRDVPDVSLNASSRVGYLVTSSDNASRTPTTYVVGGTSASAPALAGILALVGQKTGYRLGNINPTLYGLANLQASTGKAYYNLITSGNNSVPGVTGFSASTSAPRYNQVTGLGSVNGAVFVNSYTDTLPATSTALGTSASSLSVGQSLTLTATVTGVGATGTVQFTDNGSNLGTTVALSNGTATLSTTDLGVGSHSLAAVYSGDKTHQPSSSPASTVSVLMASTTSLSATPTLATVGQAVTLTASVAGNAPTGTVQFKDGGNNLGAPVAVGNGVATLSTNQLAVGSHSISAAYSGDAGNAPSTSSSTPVSVNASSTSTALSVSPAQATAGQAVTLTATVAGFQPGGSVTFLDGGTPLGSATLSNGTASLTTSNLAAGSHSLSASYAGDANNAASNSGTVPATVVSAVAEPSDGDVPTLPEWAALLLSLLLGAQAWWQRQGKGQAQGR
ncbi:MAG: IPTL-CTERM sorting domain-containing protein [Pseudomonadota bacterium]